MALKSFPVNKGDFLTYFNFFLTAWISAYTFWNVCSDWDVEWIEYEGSIYKTLSSKQYGREVVARCALRTYDPTNITSESR